MGKGSFAKVKLAVDEETGELAAIKVYEKTEFEPQSLMQAEVKAMQQLNHKHIVKMYGHFENILYSKVDNSKRKVDCIMMEAVMNGELA